MKGRKEERKGGKALSSVFQHTDIHGLEKYPTHRFAGLKKIIIIRRIRTNERTGSLWVK